MTRTGPTLASLKARAAMLTHQIRALPTEELLRLAADFWEDRQSQYAIAVAELALYLLNRMEPR